MSLAEATAIGATDTRHYAKRQFTWFRHQLPEFEWVSAGGGAPRLGLTACEPNRDFLSPNGQNRVILCFAAPDLTCAFWPV